MEVTGTRGQLGGDGGIGMGGGAGEGVEEGDKA